MSATNKEAFLTAMNDLAESINSKAGTFGRKTVAQMKTTVDNISTTASTKTVALSMASGNQVITPDAGKVLTQVTVEKPSTLTAGNIKDGVTIGGETGTFTHIASGGATASDILSGKKAYVNGAEVTGNIPTKSAATITPTTSDQTMAAGQYLAGAQTVKGDANLIAGNIKKGVTIFGVTGTYEGGGDSITIEWSFEANGTYGGVAYQTPDMSTYDASTIFANFTTETGSFDLSETTITFWGWYKYNPQSIAHLDSATYSINGGTPVDFSSTDINHPVTLNLNDGDVLTFDCYVAD